MPTFYIPDEETFRSILREELRWLVKEILQGDENRDNHKRNNQEEPVWLSLAEAKKIVPLVSKRKWKQLRDDGEVRFVRVGKGFLYSRESLFNYLSSHSNISNRKGYGKRTRRAAFSAKV